MAKRKPISSERIKEAEALVRKILGNQTIQTLDNETVSSVAHKIVRALPRDAESAPVKQRVAA